MHFSLKFLAAFAALLLSISSAQASPTWHEKRQQVSDLEISGSLAGLPAESTRYITREELLAMPQVSFSASDDTNFSGPTKISGVPLEDLGRAFGAAPSSDMVVAICDDEYRANYPRSYLAAHHPVLVLEVSGKAPSGWPKDSQEHKYDMGPYMISNPKFVPSYRILSHQDEPQIPWGVVRVEFRDEKTVFGSIAPQGPHARDKEVQDGFGIVKQNCFRCHNSGREGGQKSGLSWNVLSKLAQSVPQDFAAYIHSPASRNEKAQMPGFPEYDDATLAALTKYFQSFSTQGKP
ncbi:MAG TPA: c-type cytochrome [Candidatus Acidoferrales bacterium]|jgi:mono/diheme cytochrome c family protein|nr:c-type cytochrome [Candidatus Acidoferrales bacterium]